MESLRSSKIRRGIEDGMMELEELREILGDDDTTIRQQMSEGWARLCNVRIRI